MIFAKEPYLLHLLAGSDTITALDAAKSLLDSGTHDANEREATDNLSPLHVAAAWGHLAMCQLLIHYGADLEAKDIDKRRPVDVAASGECKQFLKRLRKKKGKERNKLGRMFAFLFRCTDTAANQSILVSPKKPYKQRTSCPGQISVLPKISVQYHSPRSAKIEPPELRTCLFPESSLRIQEAPVQCQLGPKPRRSSSLAREAFLTEDNSGTSAEQTGVAKESMDWNNNDKEEIDQKEAELRKQFSNLRLEDLKERLRSKNCAVGPMDVRNRRIYETKLAKLETIQTRLKRDPNSICLYSAALQRVILNQERGALAENEQIGLREEAQICKEYLLGKKDVSFFCYLLIDPSRLPAIESANVSFRHFLSAIFYVGKGKRSRPLQHLIQSSKSRSHFSKSKPSERSEKLRRILELWDQGKGVISLHIFYNVHSAEAFAREGAMIEAIGIGNLTNLQRGTFPGAVSQWSRLQITEFGARLLRKAYVIFQNERCRPIFEADLER